MYLIRTEYKLNTHHTIFTLTVTKNNDEILTKFKIFPWQNVKNYIYLSLLNYFTMPSTKYSY